MKSVTTLIGLVALIATSLALLQAKELPQSDTKVGVPVDSEVKQTVSKAVSPTTLKNQQNSARQVLEQSLQRKQQQQLQKLRDKIAANATVLNQLRATPKLSPTELAALSKEEKQKYQQMQQNLQQMIQQLEKADKENQHLYQSMLNAAAENEELTRRIDAMRPKILETTLRAEQQTKQSAEHTTQQVASQ